MATSTLNEIESRLADLSQAEQLRLIERLAHQLRMGTADERSRWQADLAVMASDPDIQRELQQIHKEFASTDGDGWDKE